MIAFTLQHALLPHSCFPSCGINHQNELVLLRPLETDSRLTLDYSTLFTGTCNVFECKCGCNGCRKRILGFDLLPVIFQEYYLELDAVPGEVLSELLRQPDFKIYRIPQPDPVAFYWLS